MTDEEAIERVLYIKSVSAISLDKKSSEAIETVLNLMEKKDKIINLMAERLTSPIHSKEWVIDYYKRKVEGYGI